MNILAPIQNYSDLTALVNAGATELYCGYISPKWLDLFNNLSDSRFGLMQISLNKRDSVSSNFTDRNDLIRLVAEARKYNISIYVVINNTFYPKQAYSYIREYFEDLRVMGIQHLIVSDLGLINYVGENFPEFSITVSCLNQVLNSYAVDFYKKLSVKRIVFPRHVHLNEVLNIIKKYPDMEFEVFGLCEKCIYDDGNCRCIHNIGAICSDCYSKEYHLSTPIIDRERLYLSTSYFDEWSNPLYGTITSDFFKLGCSLCSILKLVSHRNLTSIKISGRGRWFDFVISQVAFAKKVISACEDDDSIDVNSIKEMVQDQYGANFCENNINCIMKGF